MKALKAREFYAIISLATIGGMLLNFTLIDPIKALFWSALINGVIAVPVMVVMMLLAGKSGTMGAFTLPRRHTARLDRGRDNAGCGCWNARDDVIPN